MADHYTYADIVELFGEKRITERFHYLKNKLKDFLDDSGYAGLVTLNDRIVNHIIIDYFVDISRLKEFHGIEKVKTSKITAYMASWILRRKPLQFVDEHIADEDIFVNERFVAFFLLNELFVEEVVPVLSNEDMERFNDYLNLLLYYLKYRDCSAQSLELMIESFKMGAFVYQNNISRCKDG